MRILTVANHVGSRGGLERAQLEICSGLARRGHELRLLYVSEGDFLPDWREFSAALAPISGTLPRRSSPVRSAGGVALAVARGVRSHPDVVYVHRHWDVPYAVAVGAATRARTFCHIHVPPPPRVPRWLPPALRRVSGFLSVSADTAARWAEFGVDSSRVSVVPNGVDTARYVAETDERRVVTRRSLSVPHEAVVVLYAGRVDSVKGLDVLVEACQRLSRTGRSAELVIVGGRSLGTPPAEAEAYEREVRHDAQGLGVRWLEPRRDVVALLQAADVVVLPSRWPEPQPLVILEALACGTPVVASRVGGIPELLGDRFPGFMVDPDDAAQLAERLWAVAQEYRRVPTRRRALRSFVVERFSIEHCVANVEAVLGR